MLSASRHKDERQKYSSYAIATPHVTECITVFVYFCKGGSVNCLKRIFTVFLYFFPFFLLLHRIFPNITEMQLCSYAVSYMGGAYCISAVFLGIQNF